MTQMRALLSTPAGIYGIAGVAQAASAASIKPRDVKIAWARTSPHPLSSIPARRGWGDNSSVPGGQNFFPEASFSSPDPLVLLPTGAMYSVDSKTGKLTWRIQLDDGVPASPPELVGPWIQVRLSGPPGIALIRRIGSRGPAELKGLPAKRFIRGPDSGATDAVLAGGDLVAVFSGGLGVRAVESASGRLLWRALDASSQVAFASDTEVYLSEGSGKLVARSLRSGRERRTLQIPHGCAVTDAFTELTPTGDFDGWTLVLSRQAMRRNNWYYSGRNQTGVDLILLRISPKGEKVWEKELHRGAVTYAGGRFLLRNGRFLLLFSGQVDEDKWYTRAVLVETSGALEEILSAEIHGKGTGQAPRLEILKEGLALGNADGFGWYAARGKAGPSPEPAKASQ